MSAWGVLGNPDPKQIEAWKNLPYGQFKELVKDAQRKGKGKSLKKYTVEVTRRSSDYQLAYLTVEGFDYDGAIANAKVVDPKSLDWGVLKGSGEYYHSYRVSQQH